MHSSVLRLSATDVPQVERLKAVRDKSWVLFDRDVGGGTPIGFYAEPDGCAPSIRVNRTGYLERGTDIYEREGAHTNSDDPGRQGNNYKAGRHLEPRLIKIRLFLKLFELA